MFGFESLEAFVKSQVFEGGILIIILVNTYLMTFKSEEGKIDPAEVFFTLIS